MVLIALSCAAIRRDSVSLLRFPFLSHIHVFSRDMFKTPTELFFFPFLFSSHIHSVGLCVVNIISGGCNQSSSVLFYVALESCIDASTPSSMLIHIVCQRRLWDVIPYAWSLVYLFFSPFALVHFKKGPEYLSKQTGQVFIPLIRFLQDSFVSSSFLVPLRYSFLIFFISSPLV